MTRGWPEIASLELLVGIDDRGSLGAAARAAGVAQPNASRAIRQLEERFGVTLLDRSPRGSRLTPQGTMIVHWARQVLADAEQLLDAAAALRVEREAHLTVAASMTVAEYLLPSWLGALRKVNPDVQIHLLVCNSLQVIEHVTNGTCNIGFVEGPSVPDGLNKVTVARDRLVVVVHPGHPWARLRRPLTMAELAAAPLLTREPGSGTRRTVDLALEEFDRPAPLLELGSGAAIRTSALNGVGPAVISTLAVTDLLASGELKTVQVTDLDLHRTLRAVWRGPTKLAGPAGELLKLVVRNSRDQP